MVANLSALFNIKGSIMAQFIGREGQLSLLREMLSSQVACLAVIRGRRRIGKSRLIEEFGKSINKAFYFSGLPPVDGVNATEQRNEFIRQLQEQQIPNIWVK